MYVLNNLFKISPGQEPRIAFTDDIFIPGPEMNRQWSSRIRGVLLTFFKFVNSSFSNTCDFFANFIYIISRHQRVFY